jgi:arginase
MSHNLREMPGYTIIDAPSVLGLRPTGIEYLPEALKSAGLVSKLNAGYAGRVQPSIPYDPNRDPKTLLKNAAAIKAFSLNLAEVVCAEISKRNFPIMLGGDCSIIIGALLGLKRRGGRHGLFFIDGHTDFYQPQASTTGEVADMDLAIVTGRGPDILADIDGLRPFVRDEDVVVFGYRDAEQASSYGSLDVMDTNMLAFDLLKVRELKINMAASTAVSRMLKDELSGFWIHLDADVLDDRIMPAVDYRINGGLDFYELSELLRVLISTRRGVGMSITVFNPLLDPDGSIAKNLVSSIVSGLL